MKAWEAFATRDAERVAAIFTEDANWIAPLGNATAVALGYTSGMEGREAIVHFLTQEFRRLFIDDVTMDFRGFHADGATVVVELRLDAKLVNGRTYDNDYCFIFELADDGRVRQIREYMDTLGGQRMVFGDEEPRRIVA
jgi:hypothetical protein